MKSRGRPRSFDREQAVRSAMDVFWARGYEATTLHDLQAAMGGITPPSFYAAFGSKESLFLEAVDLYRTVVGDKTVRALDDQPTARAGVEAMLRETVNVFTAQDTPRGCLLVLGAMNCTNTSVQDHLLKVRRQAPQIIKRRLERGIQEGDVPAGLDVAALASFYTTIVHGLGVRARDEPSRRVLMAAVDGAMAAWDQLAAMPKQGSSARVTSGRSSSARPRRSRRPRS